MRDLLLAVPSRSRPENAARLWRSMQATCTAATTLLIGEPPGREEDRSGHPFAGAEGHLLDQMLGSIGLNRAELMLTHLLPWRPPGGRPPNPAELALCLPFLHRLIVLLRPRRILLFGGTVSRTLLGQGGARRRAGPEWATDSAILIY